MKNISRLSALLAAFAAPFVAFAAPAPDLSVIRPYSDAIINFINGILIPIFLAIAFIVFLWGVYKYFILGAADDKSRTDGRQFVLWGVIGFVVVFSVWGLVNLVRGTLGLQSGGTNPAPPTFTVP